MADEKGGKLKNRCIFFCDEFGTLPKIQDAEMIFSASRSRRLQIVPIIQSFSQLDKNYGKEGEEIMAKHTAISYYGFNYVEHAEKDFLEMKEHGCDTVILAITEFDFDFWFPNINSIVKTAHKIGLRCIADPWGIGKYFGGEQVSLFLQNNIHHRQVSAYTGEVLNHACFNTNSFRDYFTNFCLKIAKNTEVDGFFWDEPHYAYPKAYASITGGAGDDWACRCPECMKKFEEYYG